MPLPRQAITNLYAYTTATNAADVTVALRFALPGIKAANSPTRLPTNGLTVRAGFPPKLPVLPATADPAVISTNYLQTLAASWAQSTDAAGRTRRLSYDPRGSPQA